MAGVAELVEQASKLSDEEKNDFIVGVVEKMSVLNLSTLVRGVEDKFGVKASGGGGGTYAPPPITDAKAAEEKTEFALVLTAVADSTKKISVIKEVRGITGLGLKEAKDLVEGAPRTVKDKMTKVDAEGAKKRLEDVGATVELK